MYIHTNIHINIFRNITLLYCVLKIIRVGLYNRILIFIPLKNILKGLKIILVACCKSTIFCNQGRYLWKLNVDNEREFFVLSTTTPILYKNITRKGDSVMDSTKLMVLLLHLAWFPVETRIIKLLSALVL